MSDCNLLKSNGGITLIPEICLCVGEALIDSDPNAIRSLLSSSKSFYLLLKTYERSVTKTVSLSDNSITYSNTSHRKVLSSLMPPGDLTVSSLTYPWFSEMRCRSTNIEYLVTHEITEMLDDTSSWPTLDVPKPELTKRLQHFKRNALLLLYRLADCAAGLKGTQAIRIRQSEFLEGLSASELAALGCMVEVLGEGYFTMTKNDLKASGLGRNRRPSAQSNIPTSVPMDDLMNDNWIRECTCVFEDRVQRYGPYFAWAYIEGSSISRRRPDIWTRVELQVGLDNMNAYELGYTMSFASLQSVVWKVFCKKVTCSLLDSWSSAKEMVEFEMAAYQIEE